MSDRPFRPAILSQSSIRGDTLRLDLWYPPYPGEKPRDDEPARVEIGLMAVRAADSIRVSYDYDRDGWKIEQAAIFAWASDDSEGDPEWREVAFVQAWARERPECPICGLPHRETQPDCRP